MIDTGRHARHRMIDWFDQDRLLGLHAAVFGAGAIGNEVLKQLVLLGVGRITVWDRDRVELHNLTRSVLFREYDVGRAKAQVVAARAVELDPAARVDAVVADLMTGLRPTGLAGVDVVFGCLDNLEARLRLNEVCLVAAVDYVDGAIDSRHASVEHYPFSAGRRLGCYACGLPAGAWRRIAQRYSCGGLRRAGLVERKVPTTIVTSSLAAAWMVSWGLRMGPADGAGTGPAAPGTGGAAPRRLLVDGVSGRTQASVGSRAEHCPSCAPLAGERIDTLRWRAGERLAPGAAVRALAARLPEPVVLAARCGACGADASAAVPPGSRLRAHTTEALRCAACGADAVAVDGRDAVALGELLEATGGRAPALPYLWLDDPRGTLCVEIDDEDDDDR